MVLQFVEWPSRLMEWAGWKAGAGEVLAMTFKGGAASNHAWLAAG